MDHLPKQIQESAKEIEEYERQLLGAQEGPEKEQEQEPEQDQEPEAPVDEQQAPEQAEEVSQEPPSDAWKHKYKTLQGKYSAEVPRLNQELKELRQTLAQMQEQLQDQQTKKQPEPEQLKEPEKYVTDEDRDNFGEDLLEVQRRVAKEVVAELRQELSQLKQENQALKQQFGQVNVSNFQTRLLQAVPDFAEIDQDPRWITWLDEVDPMLRGPRRAIAEQAWSRGDVDAISAYVKLWKDSLGGTSPKQDRQAELKRQVQPKRANAPASVPQQGKTYSGAEAEAAFAKVQQLIAMGRMDEAQALEQEISAAYAEGRITG